MGGNVAASLFVALVVAAALLLTDCGGADKAGGGGQSAAASKPSGPDTSEGREPGGANSAASSAPDNAPAESAPSDEPKPVALTAEERQKLGIVTAPAQAITYNDSSTAFGVVLSHESIAQAVADLETATGAAHVSEIAVTRAQKLAGGPGALGVDTLETLQKQKSADNAALSLARRKLTAVVGVRFPWQGAAGDSALLDALASGEAKLVRATFPSGVFAGAAPKSLRLVPMEPGAITVAGPVWDAPQDTNLPGRSFFALLRKTDIAEGARLQVLPDAPANGITGVLIPAAAVVISGGQYWCYLEKKSDTFTRVPIVIDKPLGAGYFVSDGIGLSDGDKVVVAAAGLLLAREMNAASGPDD